MKFHNLFLLLSFPIMSCATDIRPPIPLDPRPQKAPVQSSSTVQLQRLEFMLKDDPQAAEVVADVLAVLRARIHSEQGRHAEATIEWFKAMGLAKGAFAKTTFEAWVQNYANNLGEEQNYKTLALLLLKETQDGSASPYMISMKLNNPDALAIELEKILGPSSFATLAPENDESTILLAPTQEGPPKNDSLLRKISASFCKAKHPGNYQWQAWVNTLEAPLRVYWEALIAECRGENLKAIQLFTDLIPKLSESLELAPYAIESCERLVKLQVRSALRTDVALNYTKLVELWEIKNLSSKIMGISESEFQFKRIDDYLWAARAEALVGDFTTAKMHAQAALDFIAKAPSAIGTTRQQDIDRLNDFKAEAYHLQASRIALELKEYSHASAIARIALQIPNLSAEWVERFLWTQGLYEVLDEHLDSAQKIWENLLDKKPAQDMKPRIYFWLAKTSQTQGNAKKRDQYLDRLAAEFPLNYYTFAAQSISTANNRDVFAENFGDIEKLVRKISQQSDYKLRRLREHNEIGPLLLRTEVLAIAQLYDWAESAGYELSTLVRKKFSIAENREGYLYISRLLYAAQNFKASVALTTALASSDDEFWSKWPEQILIYYPQPYVDIYQRKSQETLVDLPLLYAISRQESLFDKNAQSGSGALGLMQLIPATAKAMALDAELDSPALMQKIFQPDLNIELGSRYLKKLNLYFRGNHNAVIAAYNAGEFAVDRWLENRPHDDASLWLEFIPFQQTRQYVEAVLRNEYIYNFLRPGLGTVVIKRSMDYKNRAQVFLPKE